MTDNLQNLLEPTHLWSRSEVLGHKPCPVPEESGVYAWYFRDIPDFVPIDDCHQHSGLSLLYVGIAPRSSTSRKNLRNRIRQHYDGTARFSTLRYSLGCILQDDIGIEFWPKSGKLYLGKTENGLSQWMAENAFVTWMLYPEPWSVEKNIIGKLSLPLNLKGNMAHPFFIRLTDLRKQARTEAKARC